MSVIVGKTIDQLNAATAITANDEIAIYDAEAGAAEPTKKVTGSNLASSIKTLGSLLGTSDVVNDLTSTATDKPLSAKQGKLIYDKLGEGFYIYPGSSNGGQVVQIRFVPTESNLAGKNITLIPNTTTGITLFNTTDSATIWAEFMSKDFTGTTSTSGNVDVSLDPRTYIVYQVYSSTVNQICTAFRGSQNRTFVHVTDAAGSAVANTSVTVKIFYRKVADTLYSY